MSVKKKQARIVLLQKGANDKVIQGLTGSVSITTNQPNYTNIDTLTFTPPAAGDYVLFAQCFTHYESLATQIRIRHTNTGNSYVPRLNYLRSPSGDERQKWFAVTEPITLAASSQTFVIEGSKTNHATLNATAYNWKIIAIPLSDFVNVYHANSLGLSTTSSSSFVDKVTLSETLAEGTYLEFIFCTVRRTNTDTFQQVECKGTLDGAEISITNHIPVSHFADHAFHFSARLLELTADDYEWAIEWRSPTSGSAAITDAVIYVLELPNPAFIEHTTGVLEFEGIPSDVETQENKFILHEEGILEFEGNPSNVLTTENKHTNHIAGILEFEGIPSDVLLQHNKLISHETGVLEFEGLASVVNTQENKFISHATGQAIFEGKIFNTETLNNQFAAHVRGILEFEGIPSDVLVTQDRYITHTKGQVIFTGRIFTINVVPEEPVFNAGWVYPHVAIGGM
jgi:hypothetical protein